MLGTDDILSRLQDKLEAKEISKADIARAMKLSPQRMSSLFTGGRQLKHDEAIVLIETFKLGAPADAVSQVATTPVLSLLVRHVALKLGIRPESLDEADVDSLAGDCAAFLRFASDPKVRDNIQAIESFFLAQQAIEETGLSKATAR